MSSWTGKKNCSIEVYASIVLNKRRVKSWLILFSFNSRRKYLLWFQSRDCFICQHDGCSSWNVDALNFYGIFMDAIIGRLRCRDGVKYTSYARITCNLIK